MCRKQKKKEEEEGEAKNDDRNKGLASALAHGWTSVTQA